MDAEYFRGLNQWTASNMEGYMEDQYSDEDIMEEADMTPEELGKYKELAQVMTMGYGYITMEQLQEYGAQEVWCNTIDGDITLFYSKIKGLNDVLDHSY